MASHAQIARAHVDRLPVGVFAHAAAAGVQHQDFHELERLFPGVKFMSRPVNLGEWELVGVCADGSQVVWRVGS